AYTCSRCNSGFIEELERPQPSSSPSVHTSDTAAQISQVFPIFANVGTSRHRLNTPSVTRINEDFDVDLSDEDEIRSVGPNAVFHFTEPSPNLHGIINYVIQRLGTDLAGGGGRNPIILHGNPGDYAWGAGGLDAIISQLLNHLEGTGAPPAQREKIENLERVRINQTHIENTLQCSICMDDFELDLEVRKLPCDHLYHPECIIKWLEMHGTCPVCRKDLNGIDRTRNEDALDSQLFSASLDGASSS
ncbi:E3 ubiquitin-protein ligase RNF126, partial [Biomphalaria glabrata]